MINICLIILLFLLMIYVSGKKGIKLFISLILNFLVLIMTFYFIAFGFNSIIVTLIGTFLFTYIILYFVNGDSIKTKSSLRSVVIIILLLSVLIFAITNLSRIGGFGEEAYEEINMFSYDVRIDYSRITISLILIGLIGATIDASVAISSALYEVYRNNKNLNHKELFKSGMNIGRDILGTSTNTILFAFLGEFLTLLIWFKFGNYKFLDIINSKAFSNEFIKIMFSTLGCLFVIPTTAYICSHNYKKRIINRK